MKLTTGTFNTKLGQSFLSIATQRDNIQGFILFAAEQAASESGQLSYLTAIINKAIETKALSVKKLKTYIQAHVSNISWVECKKSGSFKFKKTKKGTAIEFAQPTAAWYEYEQAVKPATSKPRKDLRKAVTNLDKAVQGVIDGEFEANLTAEQVKDLAAHLKAIQEMLGKKPAALTGDLPL